MTTTDTFAPDTWLRPAGSDDSTPARWVRGGITTLDPALFAIEVELPDGSLGLYAPTEVWPMTKDEARAQWVRLNCYHCGERLQARTVEAVDRALAEANTAEDDAWLADPASGCSNRCFEG